MASNLFLINHDEIKRLLADANASLLTRRDNLIAKVIDLPEKLETNIDIMQAADLAAELDRAECDEKGSPMKSRLMSCQQKRNCIGRVSALAAVERQSRGPPVGSVE